MHELYAALTLAYRDLMKFLRDPPRLLATFIFPFAFLGIMGGSFQASFGSFGNLDYMAFVFTGVLGQTLFQSAALGIISLIEDRENDFSQEIFIAPISRYTIILGKIMGESLVAMAQAVGILVFALVLGIDFSPAQLAAVLAYSLIICFFGGAFGVFVLGNLSSQRAATQVFPFLMLPQYFLSGVFNPIHNLDTGHPILGFLSRISPMRYAVDLVRGAFFGPRPDYAEAVVASPATNLAIISALFLFFLVVGTGRFVRRETER